jgi:hypothetical protein
MAETSDIQMVAYLVGQWVHPWVDEMVAMLVVASVAKTVAYLADV